MELHTRVKKPAISAEAGEAHHEPPTKVAKKALPDLCSLTLNPWPRHYTLHQITYTPFFGLISMFIWESWGLIYNWDFTEKACYWDIALFASYIFYRRILDVMWHADGCWSQEMCDIRRSLHRFVRDDTPIPTFLLRALRSFSSFEHPIYGCKVYPQISSDDFKFGKFLSGCALLRLPHLYALLRCCYAYRRGHTYYLDDHTRPPPDVVDPGTLHAMRGRMPFFYEPAYYPRAPPTGASAPNFPIGPRADESKADDLLDMAESEYQPQRFFNFEALQRCGGGLRWVWKVYCEKLDSEYVYTDIPLEGCAAALALSEIHTTDFDFTQATTESRALILLRGVSQFHHEAFAPNASFVGPPDISDADLKTTCTDPCQNFPVGMVQTKMCSAGDLQRIGSSRCSRCNFVCEGTCFYESQKSVI